MVNFENENVAWFKFGFWTYCYQGAEDERKWFLLFIWPQIFSLPELMTCNWQRKDERKKKFDRRESCSMVKMMKNFWVHRNECLVVYIFSGAQTWTMVEFSFSLSLTCFWTIVRRKIQMTFSDSDKMNVEKGKKIFNS